MTSTLSVAWTWIPSPATFVPLIFDALILVCQQTKHECSSRYAIGIVKRWRAWWCLDDIRCTSGDAIPCTYI
jgi:hypothetical protein